MPSQARAPRPLSLADLDRATEVLSLAFLEDPLWLYLLPDEKARRQWIPRFFRAYLSMAIRSGQAQGVSDPLAGVALWRWPGQEWIGVISLLRSGLLRLAASPLLLSSLRALRVLFGSEAMHRRYAPEPHLYLMFLGVHPDWQGQGLASRLVRPCLAEADTRGLAAYTETMTPGNVGLYAHYGFRVVGKYRVPRAALTVWGLKREPGG